MRRLSEDINKLVSVRSRLYSPYKLDRKQLIQELDDIIWSLEKRGRIDADKRRGREPAAPVPDEPF